MCTSTRWLATGILVLTGLGRAPSLDAHCDTLGGPVVGDARAALAGKQLTPVLKWLRPDREKEVREVFDQVLRARGAGEEARAVADRLFLETVVRVHREGEGASFTGLKPEGAVEPAIAEADGALASGAVDALAKKLAAKVEQGVRERFERAAVARKRAADSVAAGREFVAAYVEYVHYVERLDRDASGAAGHAPAEGHAAGPVSGHEHAH